ncbi:protein Abitram [Toxorhynchites rutilus septentrionalis]|uniref:protein Abitram n=1 Tax=Toxorhynchites rutilus septentrionalis TaxID=329112 RepID=UPI002479E863|nr:protein Abitram [Toxorhynchites rutilus septentrionalis]
MTDLESYYLQEEPQIICGETVPSIVEDYAVNYPSIVDRFFTRYYYVYPGKEDEPHLVLFHSNRICLIGLKPGHVAFKLGIESVSFEVGRIDRSQNHVSGKKKSGGMIVQADSTLALITCKDGSVYKVRGCVQGKLVEVNQNVTRDLELLGTEGEGYIAVVMPKPEQCETIKGKLRTHLESDTCGY